MNDIPDDETVRMNEESFRLYEEGRAAMDAGDHRLAIERFKQSIAIKPHYKTYELLGEVFLMIGEYGDAVLYLAAASGLGNREIRSRFLLAKALLALDSMRAHDAVLKLKEAICFNPQYKSAKDLLEEILSRDKVLAARVADDEEWEQSVRDKKEGT
jgi:tetratricopeptide (TPR) repeat protein